MAVSQCTLCANKRKGHKPSFIKAAQTDAALYLFHRFCDQAAAAGVNVARVEIAAHMAVELVNDGLVTIWPDSREV